jgi:hypothetical protein
VRIAPRLDHDRYEHDRYEHDRAFDHRYEHFRR